MGSIIVIGGGAAGMLAAGTAAERGHSVLLLEKNEKLGKKLYITGKGRCNFTNSADFDVFLENFPGNHRFMYSALKRFDNHSAIDFFERLGVKTKIERGGRVFPESDKASDIINALERYIKKAGVKIRLNTCVESLAFENGQISGVFLKDTEKIKADAVIIATGGLSYPSTGSTGDGYAFAESAGHTIAKTFPSLVSLRSDDEFCRELMGLSLKNTSVSFVDEKGKVRYRDFGEMLFTHFGVSGPVVLSGSRHISAEGGRYRLFIDLKPALDEKTLDLRIQRDFSEFSNKDFKNSLQNLLPQKLIPVIIDMSGISPEKKVREITKDERRRLGKLIKNFQVSICGTNGYNEAIVTGGGVNVSEINPKTMESKIIKGLYFAGEVIDVDGYTGGFNLQIAFSTGFLAGSSV